MTSFWQVKRAKAALEQGGVIAYPTEAVYGLGCLPQDPEAVERLLEIKRRPVHKGLILIAGQCVELQEFVDLDAVPENIKSEIARQWPGPVTFVLPAKQSAPKWITGDFDTIAVRMTNHRIVKELCTAVGSAIVSTSANLSGHPAARNSITTRKAFRENIDHIVVGKTLGLTKPSRIIDPINNKILRS